MATDATVEGDREVNAATRELPLAVRPAVWARLSPMLRERMTALEGWSLEFLVPRLQGHPPFEGADDVRRCLRYYKQFMYFKGARPDQVLGMYAPRVDAVWHEHVLHTANYAAFCRDLFGHFVHHTPSPSLTLRPTDVDAWNNWYFGEYPATFEDTCPLESPDAPIRCG